MKCLISIISVLTVFAALSACDRKPRTLGEKIEDKVKDATDQRPGEKVRDAAEDAKDAVKEAGRDVKDAVKDATR